MSIQARMSENDPRLYNPSRDLAHCFGHIMTATAQRLEAGNWSVVAQVLKEKGVTEAELGRACQAVCRFVLTSVDDPKESMAAVLRRVGWFDLAPVAQMGLMAVFGSVVLGMSFVGFREATLGGSGPVQTYQDLERAGAECASMLLVGRWRRCWQRFRARLARVWRALRGGK